MNCDFERRGDWCVCRVCGYATKSKDCGQVFSNCAGKKIYHRPASSSGSLPKSPTLAAKVVHYAEAVAGHIAGGCQTRTDGEVSDLLKICEACEHFLPDKGSCGICGCKCNRNASAWTNKLRMKTQKCPKGKW